MSCARGVPVTACLIAILSLVSVNLPGRDARSFLSSSRPDATTLLAPPPLIGSAEQQADLDTVRSAHRAATSNDLAIAATEKKLSLLTFTSVVGPELESESLAKTRAFLAQVHKEAAALTDLAKDFFKRPRPFVADPNLAGSQMEKTYSYPSGHSTESMVIALVLSELFPERKEALLAKARLIGWHRVQLARHYPTDIYAGRVLAQAIFRELQASRAFQQELEEVRQEIATVKATPPERKHAAEPVGAR